MKITGFGDYLIHFSPIHDERFMQTDYMHMTFTGAEANVCAALAFWGENTRFVTKLPKHLLSKRSVAFLTGCGVDTSYIAYGEGRMGVYYLEKGQSLRSSVVIYDRVPSAFTESRFEDYDWNRILADTSAFYLCGITPALSDNLFQICRKVLPEARKQNIPVFFDLNYRPALGSTECVGEIFRALAPYITHLIGNEEHLKMILGISSCYGETEATQRLADLTDQAHALTGIPQIAVTVRRTIDASNTIIYASYSDEKEFAISPEYLIQVVDRVGSGDAFSAGLVYGVMHGLSVADTVRFAAASNAMKHTIHDDINFASVEEINALLHRQGYDVRR